MIQKVKKVLFWIYDHPEFLFSAYFGALACTVPGLMMKGFFVVLVGQELYKAYLKEKERRLQIRYDRAMECLCDVLNHVPQGELREECFGILKKHRMIGG